MNRIAEQNTEDPNKRQKAPLITPTDLKPRPKDICAAMNGLHNDGTFPSFVDACTARYPHTIVDRQRIGTNGAFLVRFERGAGHYQYDATSDFALVMLQNGGFIAELDLGVGRFSASVAPGQLFLSPPFTAIAHAFPATTKGLVLALAEARLCELLPGLDLKPEAGFRELYTRPIWDDFIRIGVNQLWAATCSREHADSLFADAAISAIFAALARHGKQKRVESAKHRLSARQLRCVMQRLETFQDATLAELAASANLSPFYFARAFKHTTGLPPHHYQLRLRIERAKDLLTRSRLPINEIAMRVGYGSGQTFARVFRKDVGTSPAEYRRTTTA